VYIDNITVIVTVRVLPSGVAIANSRFTFYNCSALDTYEQIIQSSTSIQHVLLIAATWWIKFGFIWHGPHLRCDKCHGLRDVGITGNTGDGSTFWDFSAN